MKPRSVFVLLFFFSVAKANPLFPMQPDPQLTPGELCSTPDSFRYPAQIPYCERDLATSEKWMIIQTYMHKLQFVINQSNREDFKIDHFIPLCMGGANTTKNLWPQHKSIYVITDPLERILCERLASGRITQKQAIDQMKFAKFHLDQVPGLLNQSN